MMKKILFLVMAVLTAASMMIAGCGGGDKKAAEPEKVLRVGTELPLLLLNSKKRAVKAMMVLTWIWHVLSASKWATRLKLSAWALTL